MTDTNSGDRTVEEIEDDVRTIEDPGELSDLLSAEEDGKDRTTAKEVIRARIDEVAEATDGGEDTDDADDTETEGEYEATEEDVESPDEGEETADKKHVRALENGVYRDMWVYCETQGGELLDVSKEMLGKARELMDGYAEDYGDEERVVAVLVGDDMEELAEECITLGADVAVYLDDDRLERFRHKPYTEIVADMARTKADWKEYDKPRYFLFPATNNGRDLSAQVQGELDSGLASDCSGLTITDELISNPVKTGQPGEKIEFERILHMQRPDFSGFEYSTILCIDNPDREFHPQGCSVIPGSFDAMEPDGDREGEVVSHDIDLPDDWFRVEVTEWDTLDTGVDLSGREVIVAIGRGIGDDPTEGIEIALDLVDAFEDADLGLSRGVVTASYNVEGHVERYVSEERQIGETGQVVAPPLYIAAGISGAIQHKVGMDESETIIAINTDTDADIRDFSDFFIEGDMFDVLPRLTDAVQAGELDAVVAEDDD
jgi:electron transfer flavoprotein alpha subunit